MANKLNNNIKPLYINYDFTNKDLTYLGMLINLKGSLLIKNTLRNRKYTNIDVKAIEYNMETKDIKHLLDTGVLIRVSKTEDGYNVMDIHPDVKEHVRKYNNQNKQITIDNHDLKFTYIRNLTKNERTQLKKTANKLSPKFSPKEFRHAAFINGYTLDSMFYMQPSNVVCCVIHDTNLGTLQVFPKDIFVEKEKVRIKLEHKITDTSVSISSEETSSSYISYNKVSIPVYNDIKNNYKQAKKYLQECKVRTKGKKELDTLFKDPNTELEYDKFVTEYNKLFDELLTVSKKLVEEGMYMGGISQNPLYKKGWDIMQELQKLVRQPKIVKLVTSNRRFNEIIAMYSDDQLSSYNMLAL